MTDQQGDGDVLASVLGDQCIQAVCRRSSSYVPFSSPLTTALDCIGKKAAHEWYLAGWCFRAPVVDILLALLYAYGTLSLLTPTRLRLRR